jgi:hypothetical protein
VVPSIGGLRLMEMEKATKEAEAAHIPGGVWVWLPDRRCLVDQHVAASISEKNPLPESLQPPCNSPPQGFLESFEGASPVVFRGSFKRGLSEDEIAERNLSSCSQNVLSPTVRVATPETPSAAAFKRKRADDGKQWGTRSDVNSAAYKAKELTARDGSEMCECGVSLDACKCE